MKKILAIILSLAIVGANCILPVSNEFSLIKSSLSVSAETYEDYSYEIKDDGTAEITKLEMLYDCYYDYILIPSEIDGYTVTSIGNDAFNVTGLQDIIIPKSITSIGDRAFYNCRSLERISFLGDVESIGQEVFISFYPLTIYANPGTKIQSYAEDNDVRFILIDSETVSGDFTYEINGAGTAEITYWSGTDSEVVIPSELDGYTVTSIFGNAFEYNGDKIITSITLPDSITSIGKWAFMNCQKLVSINIPENVTKINVGAFYACISLQNITIPESVTSIGQYAFNGCALTDIIIPDSVTSIIMGAFYSCKNLKSVKIGESVTSIGESAFEYCESLTDITIPASVTYIGASAFQRCPYLTGINVDTNNKFYSSVNGILFDKNQTALIAYPLGISQESYNIPNGVKSIGDNVFYNCTSLTSITIPDSVTSIGQWAFMGTNITSIELPDSVTSIGGAAFSSTALTDVIIPDSVTNLSWSVFVDCKNLTSVKIPDGITSIEEYTFYDCESLTDITIPDGVTSIGNQAFSGCSSLTNLTIPESVTSIGEWAFANCGLKSVTIPGSITNIELGAFEGSSLESVTIQNGVKRIGNQAFNWCRNLNSVTIPDSVTEIGIWAFGECTSLKSIIIPNMAAIIEPNSLGYRQYTVKDGYELTEDFTISGYNGSTAETYATENKISFVTLGKPPSNFTLSSYVAMVKYMYGGLAYDSVYDLNGDGAVNIIDTAFARRKLLNG